MAALGNMTPSTSKTARLTEVAIIAPNALWAAHPDTDEAFAGWDLWPVNSFIGKTKRQRSRFSLDESSWLGRQGSRSLDCYEKP
jgi:hypothetical protein